MAAARTGLLALRGRSESILKVLVNVWVNVLKLIHHL